MFLQSDPKRQVVTKMIGFYPVAGNAAISPIIYISKLGNAFAVYKNLDRRLPL
jgi:hypothetical protein